MEKKNAIKLIKSPSNSASDIKSSHLYQEETARNVSRYDFQWAETIAL